MAASKRQTTFAKMAREQAMREKRVRKQEKKDDKKQAAIDAANGVVTPETPPVDEARFVAVVLHEALAAVQVLAQVVEEHVDRGGVAARRPVTGGCVEGDLDVPRDLAAGTQEVPHRLVDIVQHLDSVLPPVAAHPEAPDDRWGTLPCPFRQSGTGSDVTHGCR